MAEPQEYRVRWEIDEWASSPREAVKKALRHMLGSDELVETVIESIETTGHGTLVFEAYPRAKGESAGVTTVDVIEDPKFIAAYGKLCAGVDIHADSGSV